jgi:hypothetical protein
VAFRDADGVDLENMHLSCVEVVAMNGVALLVALASLGVDYDVQRLEDGKLEYVIQIEPEFLRLLAEGQPIQSDVPANAGQVERILVRVGTSPARHSPAHQAEYRNLLTSSARYASRAATGAATDASTPILWPAKAKPQLTYHVTCGFQPDQAGVMSYYMQLNPNLLASLAVGDEIRAAVDPAAGRVGRFLIHAGEAELPKVPAAPAAAASAPLASAAGSRRAASDRTGFGASTRDAATATTQPAYGPATGIAPSSTLPSAPDFGSSPTHSGQSQYADRGSAYGGISDTGGAPGYSQPPTNYGAGNFDRARGAVEQPPVEYGPPAGYAARPPIEQQPLPPRTSTFAPPAYAPQPIADERFASVTRPPSTTSAPLAAPQVNPTSSTRTSTSPVDPDKPWMPLMFTAFALFLSIGGNLYLGWTAAEFYSRYRLATDRLRSAGRG